VVASIFFVSLTMRDAGNPVFFSVDICSGVKAFLKLMSASWRSCSPLQLGLSLVQYGDGVLGRLTCCSPSLSSSDPHYNVFKHKSILLCMNASAESTLSRFCGRNLRKE
jgi:hypothetical protein